MHPARLAMLKWVAGEDVKIFFFMTFIGMCWFFWHCSNPQVYIVEQGEKAADFIDS